MALDKAVDGVFDFFGRVGSAFADRLARPVARFFGAARKRVSASLAAGAASLAEGFQRALEDGNPLAVGTAKGIRLLWLWGRRAGRFAKARAAWLSRKAAPPLRRLGGLVARLAGQASGAAARAARAAARRWHGACDAAERHKKAFLGLSAVVTAVAVCAAYVVNAHTAYEYMYNGKTLGLVKDKSVVLRTVALVGSKLSEAYGANIVIDAEADITFNKVFLDKVEADDAEDVLRQLTYMKDMKVIGYVLVADGNELAVFDSRETAQKLLESVQQSFIEAESGDKEYLNVGFSEDITIAEVDTRLANLDNLDQVLDHVMTGDVVQRYHVVEKGETLSGIAKENGIKTAEIMALNPEVTPEKLMIGQEVKLEKLEPLLTVETTEVATYNEAVPYEIVYEDTSAMYKGEQTVKLAGKKGERQVTAEITRQNGVETGKKELASVVLSEPTNQVVLVGSKETPPLIGLGNFKYPVRGRLTSRFGPRWGRMHNGIDLAAPTGTKIYAADGGKVVSAGWAGSLGYTVKIDHGANRQTVYGHCSKLFVKAGDKVYQGQHIANVGNTGNSTGSHLHFEVHINGVVKNPLNYL
jgi:murein DD-endopeptidase MepM/ murein hydrolase activator NlpD